MHPNINLCLLEFIKNLEAKLKLDHCDIKTIIIKCKIADNNNINNDKCHAVVHNINGTVYQCTRKKKFGCFCGLHHNRKNGFKTIYQNNAYDESIYRIETKDMIKEKFVNNSDVYKIYHNFNEYYINPNTGIIYQNEYNDNYVKELLPIGNINTSNLPFTI